MKYKIKGFLTIALALIAVVWISFIMPEDNGKRYHQHIEAKKLPNCVCANTELCTHLPIIKIETGGKPIPGEIIYNTGNRSTLSYTMSETGEETILSTLSIIDNEDSYNHPEDVPAVTSDIRIRIRGNSSRHFEKKGYIIKMQTADGLNNPQKIMGMDSHHEWALHGPYLDKTLIRN